MTSSEYQEFPATPKAQESVAYYDGSREPSIVVKGVILLTAVAASPLWMPLVILGGVYFAISRTVKQVLYPPPKEISIGWVKEEEQDKSIYHNTIDRKFGQLPTYKPPTSSPSFQTCYVTMKDGTRIALDVRLPKTREYHHKHPVPIIFHQARYYRSMVLRWPLNKWVAQGQPFNFINGSFFGHFLEHGYGVVSMDIRGTGASFGTHMTMWGEKEQSDAVQVLDWIVAQPWCNGDIGLWGISYEATAAFFTLAHHHPNVKAAIPMYMFWDLYHDISCPGGIPQYQFPTTWQNFNSALDKDAFGDLNLLNRLFVGGVTPVASEREILDAVKDHEKNWKVTDDMEFIQHRDSVARTVGLVLDSVSAHNVVDKVKQSNVPILFYSGWFDCTARSALQGYKSIPNSSVILGPWNHGGVQHLGPDDRAAYSKFDHAGYCSAFFNRYLRKGASLSDEVACPRTELGWSHFYCIGENKWNHTTSWPVQNTELPCMYLSSNDELTNDLKKVGTGITEFHAAHENNLSGHSRWEAMVDQMHLMSYKGWEKCGGSAFTSAPLPEDMKIVGTPVVDLYLSSSDTNADILAYLLVQAEGSNDFGYITEGHVRASHQSDVYEKNNNESEFSLPEPTEPHIPRRSFLSRDERHLIPGKVCRVRFDMLPTSYLFKKGSRMRLQIMGNDPKHFVGDTPSDRRISIFYDKEHHSNVQIPVVPCSDNTPIAAATGASSTDDQPFPVAA